MTIDSRGLRVKFAWLLSVTPLLFSNVSAQTSDDAEFEDVEEIIVTGSRIPRSGFDTLQPAIVIDSEFLEDRGFTDVATALNELPAFGMPGNSTQGTQGSQSVGQSFVNLYGLGSQRTLTLVNGRRFVAGNSPSLAIGANAGAQVDLNMIPTALVDRIETISIGGAPIYGADAIAGTVNVIMKSDFEGLEFRSSYGQSAEGEMEETVFSLAWGANSADGRGNVTLGVEHSDREGMIESDMPHLQTGWQFREQGDPNFDLSLISPGYANIVSNNGILTPGNLMLPNFGVGQWPDGSYTQFAPDGGVQGYNVGEPTANAVWSVGGEGLFLPDVTPLYTPLKRTLATAFASYEIAPEVEIFAEVWAGQSEATELVNQPAYQSGFFATYEAELNFQIDHPYLTQEARDFLANQGADNFYLHRASTDLQPGNQSNGKVNLYRGVLGFRGDFVAMGDREFTWDVSFNRGRTDMSTTDQDLDNNRFFYALDAVQTPDGIQCRVVADPSSRPPEPSDPFGTSLPSNIYDDCQPLNLFGQGQPSQAALQYINVLESAVTTIDQEVIEANFGTGNLIELPAGGLGVNLGISTRTESSEFAPSGFTQAGYGRNDPLQPVVGEFTSDEIYGEFFAPIISPDMDFPLVYNLQVEGAYRYLDNDRAGTDDVWTMGFKYAPIPDIEFRANVTESVRAPAIQELFLPQSGTSSFAGDPCDATLVNSGPNPAARLANCEAGGAGLPPIDTSTFVSQVRNASVNGTTGGNTSLVNETAETWTAGIIFRPRFLDGLQWSIDYIDFDIADAITEFTLTNVMTTCYDADAFPNPFCSQFQRQADGQLPPNNAFQVGFVNAGQRTYKAYVSEILYGFDALGGDWDIFGSLQHVTESTRTLLGATTDFRGEVATTAANPGAPEWQANIRVRYSRDRWSAFLQPRFIGEGIWDNDAAPDRFTVPGEDNVWIWNTGFNYEFTDSISAQLNINNISDKLPSPGAIATGNDSRYDNVGRFYRVSLQIAL
jgi:outer membrane receptor protein involved in Fe transport